MNDIITGDCLTVLGTLPSESVQVCVTSPPYYGLRDYGVENQIGLESHPSDYIAALVEVFREVRRVLRSDGVLWLNIGDSYVSQGQTLNEIKKCGTGQQLVSDANGYPNRPRRRPQDFKNKDLMMIPARVAIALQEDGWWLRSDIIWHKLNAMPESVTGRPTSAHEHIFLLAKSERYFYDADAIREPHDAIDRRGNRRIAYAGKGNPDTRKFSGDATFLGQSPLGRNKRNVWSIASQPYSEAHFAVMPPKLVEPCILAGSRPGDVVLDPFAGAGTVLMVASQLGRDWLGIELNPAYVELIRKRLDTIQPNMWESEAIA